MSRELKEEKGQNWVNLIKELATDVKVFNVETR